MEELRNLKQIYSLAAGRFNQYEGKDFVLPRIFKEQVTEINSNTITYNDYSAVIETRGNQNGVLNIYLPNQWFYIASYFTDFYNELQRYKKEALKVVSKERLKDLNGSSLTEQEESRLQRLSLTNQSKSYLRRFMTDYSWWYGAKTIDRGDFYVSPILNSARLVNASQSFVADLCAFLANKTDLVQAIISGEEAASKKNNSRESISFQQIFYGAPGTGKSHIIKELTKGEDVIRTTFHPDTDYSTFVGTYKPTTEFVPVLAIIGDKAVETGRQEKRISYEFVSQAFLQAYTDAWKKVAVAQGGKPQKQFLVIEEINRGNCAQIFGDLFQLLDRNDFGYSDYPIKADADMQKQLKRLFEGVTITDADSINAMYDDRDIVKEVLSGEVLLLPNNLYIWATMNTSDQSLFPIDSAFKRRWDWQYMPISDGGKQWVIEIGSQKYSWWSFIQKINNEIYEKTNSEDKKLGYYFCKPINGVIKVETFVSKVLFYLWNDVFKDFEEDNGLFVESYDKFYTEGQNGMPLVIKEKVVLFMQKLGVEEFGLSESMVEEEPLLDEDGNSSTLANNRNFDYSKYSVNGEGAYPKGAVAQQAIKQFVLMNPDMSANDVIRTWLSLNVKVPNFIETIQMYNERTAGSSDSVLRTRYKTVEMPNGETLYVSNQYNVERINDLISKVNAQPWGIHIEKVSIGN